MSIETFDQPPFSRTYFYEGKKISAEEYEKINFNIPAGDYVWTRVLPDDPYENGIDAIWCHKEDQEEHPVELNTKVEYHKYNPMPYPGPSALGTIIAIFEGIGEVDKRGVCFARPYKGSKNPPISSFTPDFE